ncbi:MAG TPA: hypothetical protein VGQ62_12460 [Chloroflexota bacterium]|nr:hypothetical protein [Chloroflexota bacterium]
MRRLQPLGYVGVVLLVLAAWSPGARAQSGCADAPDATDQPPVALGRGVGLAVQCGIDRPQPTAIPTVKATTSPTPPPGTALERHDWRAEGYASVVGGVLYDALCVPLESVGSNVLNLPFRSGLDADLEWMRAHNIRWLRVLATGHGLSSDRAPRDAAAAIAALGSLLDGVESFNAAHAASETIYAVIGLTDYYPPGVPGDPHAYDHPLFRDVPVLPAPWYRAGVSVFDYDQEHGYPREIGLANYEQYYKPWVESIVTALANRPAVLGWQLGNELKARGSARNGVSSEQAYAWYLAFTRDTVDTIRRHDRHHVVFTGTQYVAELTDYEYRPAGQLAAALVPGYREIHRRLLADCGQWCWNVLGVTFYDFNPYALDDALLAQQARVAVSMTEYGFTNRPTDTPADRTARYGGDRAAAVRNGLGQSWQTVDGANRPSFPGAADLVASGLVGGVAPWASPSPYAGPDRGMDLDGQRGVTDAPDATALWDAWSATGARLEAANRSAGRVAACLGAHSE